jgi:hypothetical protein
LLVRFHSRAHIHAQAVEQASRRSARHGAAGGARGEQPFRLQLELDRVRCAAFALVAPLQLGVSYAGALQLQWRQGWQQERLRWRGFSLRRGRIPREARGVEAAAEAQATQGIDAGGQQQAVDLQFLDDKFA